MPKPWQPHAMSQTIKIVIKPSLFLACLCLVSVVIADSYDRKAAKLVQMFIDNFTQYEGYVSEDVLSEALKTK